MQRGIPLEHSCVPTRHTSPPGLQAVPVVHAPQLPAPSQTIPAPHIVPAATLPAATHTAAPLEQSVIPTRHGCPLIVHADPPAHATQLPVPSHTMLEPHVVPAGALPAGMHTGAPVEQAMRPVRHAPPV